MLVFMLLVYALVALGFFLAMNDDRTESGDDMSLFEIVWAAIAWPIAVGARLFWGHDQKPL